MKIANPTHFPLAIPMAGFLLAAGPLFGDQLLFSDTFDRANSSTTDGSTLNESAAGKSGAFGALTWTGRTALLNTGNIVDINSNRLRMDAVNTNGGNGGLAYISDHNFIDASIKSAGTFKVSIDISSGSSSGESRFLGFGVGQSLAELDALASASPHRPSAGCFHWLRRHRNDSGNRGVPQRHERDEPSAGVSGRDAFPPRHTLGRLHI